MRLYEKLNSLVHPHVLYDTVEVQLPADPGFEYALFRDLMGKTREQTNFDVPLRLHVGERFRLDSVHVKVSDDALWGVADFTLKTDDHKVFDYPLAHFGVPLMASSTFEDNTDIRGWLRVVRPVPGTGTATVRVELHGVLGEPLPKDWRPDDWGPDDP